MSDVATYTFLPWLRQGIANSIGGHAGQRATIPIELTLRGTLVGGGESTRPPIARDVEIYGPGDVVGIQSSIIIRTEPKHWVTNFEPNYLPSVEFYDEDFPWRYSPVTPDGHRLLPWLALVVLKEGEFKEGQAVKERPLAYVATNAETKLPPASQLWAWAHVHVNKNLVGSQVGSSDRASIEAALGAALRADPDLGYSRIVSPRRLAPNTSYHAFLVPTFEAGRLSGLGLPPDGATSAAQLAWSDDAVPAELPFYHRWYFRTGNVGDFEYLVRLLKPQPVDSRVGLRDMDVQRPGANLRGILDAPGAPEAQALHGALKLGGALRIPDIFYSEEEFAVVLKYRNWARLTHAYPEHPFLQDLAAFINLTDDYAGAAALTAHQNAAIGEEKVAEDPTTEYDIGQNPDPVITAPLYGRWHALTQRLLTERDGTDANPNDNWVHELNLDPRWRSAAGFGTAVVQDNQEDYMQAAWEQVGKVLEANQRIKHAQLAKEAAFRFYRAHLAPAPREPDRWLMVSAPLHARVLAELVHPSSDTVRKATLRAHVQASRIPLAALSVGMRKQLRPRGPLAKRLALSESVPASERHTVSNLVSRMNADPAISAAPVRASPPALSGHQDAARTVQAGAPLGTLGTQRWVLLALLLLVVVGLVVLEAALWVLVVVAAVFAALLLLPAVSGQARARSRAAQGLLPQHQAPELVDAWPRSPDFRVVTGGASPSITFGTRDSEEGALLKAALKDAYALTRASVAASVPVVKPPLDIAAAVAESYAALDPERTIPRWVWGSVAIPGRIKDEQEDELLEAMAYPELELPMYKPLVKRSTELFLPNLQHVAPNSISLLETNQPFIEAYMVGLNHEFARELLWREYPTDQRGSYFRQFWEAQGYHTDEVLDPEILKERLRDIPPIHLWSKRSKLGDHDHREEGGEKEEEAVLVIRGELLKKYPNAVIYAQRAVWKDEDGEPIVSPGSGQTIDPARERDLAPMPGAGTPPRTLLKTPLYEAKVDPDIHFFGFDLTVCKAKGGTGKEDVAVDARCVEEGVRWDDPGWFFVIKERPGEPRLGLDVPPDDAGQRNVDDQGRVEVWNDLSWADVSPAVLPDGFLRIDGSTEPLSADQPLEADDDEKQEQQDEDRSVRWTASMSAADVAYVLYQVPVLVAVHAAEMLPEHPPARSTDG